MKRILFFSLLSLFILSCSKVDSDFLGDEQKLDTRIIEDKIDVCHLSGNGEYHTISISPNALEAHLAHGDYEGECTDCDAVSCFFCNEDNLAYFDFDEPCDEIPWMADYYCQGEINLGVPEGGVEDKIRGWACLVDYDSGYCFEDPEGEDDDGHLWAIYRSDGFGNYYGQSNLYYNDYNDPENHISLFFGEMTQEAYERAIYCASIIAEINASLAIPLTNLNGEGGMDEGEECLQLAPEPFPMKVINQGNDKSTTMTGSTITIDPTINSPEEFTRFLKDFRSKLILRK